MTHATRETIVTVFTSSVVTTLSYILLGPILGTFAVFGYIAIPALLSYRNRTARDAATEYAEAKARRS